MSVTSRRILTAGILLGWFVPAALWAPSWLWGGLMTGGVGLAAFEWGRLSGFPAHAARLYALLFAVVVLALPGILAENWPVFRNGLFLLAAVFWLLAAPLWLLGRRQGGGVALRAAVGVVLLLPTWAALVWLHARGPGTLFGVLAVVWIADTAAYFAGRSFGRRKLAPGISPGKTWEGVIGALAALALYAAVLAALSGLPAIPLLAGVSGLLYLSILGDLFESWIKRLSGMKDSGGVLPGHGGVLDRIDGLTATLPVAAGLLLWLEHAA